MFSDGQICATCVAQYSIAVQVSRLSLNVHLMGFGQRFRSKLQDLTKMG